MSKMAESMSMTENTAAFEAEHVRTHRRWASTVLALYGLIVSIGIIATLVHSSTIVNSKAPAMQLQARAQTP
jgi:hypothetical protein